MLIYQTLLYLPAQLFGPAFQLLAAIAWTHWLSPSEYGVLALIIAAQDLVFYVCLSWWSQYTTRYYAAHQVDNTTSRYQSTENGVLACSVIVQLFAALAALAISDAPLRADLICATLAFVVTRSITAHLAERSRASGRIGSYTLAQTAGPVIGCLIGFGVIMTGQGSATAVLVSFAFAQTLALPVLWRMLNLGTAVRFDRSILSTALRYGTPLLIASVVTWLSVNGLRVVVDWFEGAAAVGLVSVGWSLGQRASSVAAMLVTAAAYPLAVSRAVTQSREAALTQLSQSGALLFGVIAPVAVGALIVNRSAVNLLIGADFRDLTVAILPIAILSGAIRNFRLHYADQTFLLCERTDAALFVSVMEAALTLPLCIVGLRVGGLVGACLGCLVAHAIAAIVTFLYVTRRFLLPVPWGHLVRVAFATAAMAGSLMVVPWPPNKLGLGLETVAGCLVYAAAIAALYWRDIREMLAVWHAAPAGGAAG
jgi:O-antigen/teichoic acid export membrane protein